MFIAGRLRITLIKIKTLAFRQTEACPRGEVTVQSVDCLLLAHPIEAAEVDIARFAQLFPINARPAQIDALLAKVSGLHERMWR